MNETIRAGTFSSAQQETVAPAPAWTAPPWSGGWLTVPTEAIEQRATVGTFPRSHGETVFKGYLAAEEDSSTFVDRIETQGEGVQNEERKKKLFVGMAPKSAYEEDYKVVFEFFGTPTDIYVIRDRNGFSKGCAFVKYKSVKSARNAIEALHDKYTMPGGFRTLVVTVADDRRESYPPRSRDTVGGGGSTYPGPLLPCFEEGRCRGNSQSLRSLAAPGMTVATSQSTCPRAATALQHPVVAGMPYMFCGGTPPQGTYVYYPFVNSSASDRRLSSKPHHTVTVGSVRGVADRCKAYDNACECATSAGAPGPYRVYDEDAHDGVSRRNCQPYDLSIVDAESKSKHWAKQIVGPPGANLFVYYLPRFLSDAGLAKAFAPFGKVLSAKVYYDRDTGDSKGFGFVSYADPDHADDAIARMNGFLIGQKRLKVVRKRGQERMLHNSIPVSDPCHGGGSNHSLKSIHRLSCFGSGGCDGYVSGGCDGGGDTIWRRDLKGQAPSDLDINTPERLLGASMTRQAAVRASINMLASSIFRFL